MTIRLGREASDPRAHRVFTVDKLSLGTGGLVSVYDMPKALESGVPARQALLTTP
jgi:hypothetical protein